MIHKLLEWKALLRRRRRHGNCGGYLRSGDLLGATSGGYLLSGDLLRATSGGYLRSGDLLGATSGVDKTAKL